MPKLPSRDNKVNFKEYSQLFHSLTSFSKLITVRNRLNQNNFFLMPQKF